MVQNCCVVFCNNRSFKGCSVSFHSFPHPIKDSDRRQKWISAISRAEPDGKPWMPKKNDKVCSEHFLVTDYVDGKERHMLNGKAVPSNFPDYPAHKQQAEKKRPSPKKRKLSLTEQPALKRPSANPSVSVKLDHTYHSPSAEAKVEQLQKRWIDTCRKLKERNREVKLLTDKLKRRESKISNLLQQLQELKLLNEEHCEILKENFPENTFLLIENELAQQGKSKSQLRYSDEIKAFAVTLHYYSAAAYEYLRSFLHLPHAASIRRWASSYDVEPGYLRGVLSFMAERLKDEPDMKDVVLMFDSMSIRKELVYVQNKGRYVGCVNHGYLQPASEEELATEALVFMAVGMKKYFKYPVAYFLIDKITAQQQSQLVKDSITLLSEAGFTTRAVVCDSAPSNQATATKLGCVITTTEVNPTFPDPTNVNRNIYFIFDAAHLLKNVRNCLGDRKLLKVNDQSVKWEFICQLHKLQSNHTLFLANKLRAKHIDYIKNKMKVSLAAQTLSSSVANAIDYLREELNVPEFAGSEATTVFIRTFDAIFDMCNASNCLGKGLKSPISSTNFEERCELANDAISYISSICDANGTSILTVRRKAGFLGFIATLKSVIGLSRDLLMDSGYRFVLPFRLSQDHLETYFSKIRRRGGNNNNPNALQLQWAMRALLHKNGVGSSVNANCRAIPEVNNTLIEDAVASDATPTIRDEESFQRLNESGSSVMSESESPHPGMVALLMRPGLYHNHVLHYIAGFVCRKIQKKIKCSICATYLSTSTSSSDAATFTRVRDRGGLIYASNDLLNVVTTADRCLRRLLVTEKGGPLLSVSTLTTRLVTHEVLECVGLTSFQDLKAHCLENHSIEHQDDHATQIIKEICAVFCNLMLTHHGRLFNERFVRKNEGSQRHKLAKTILFLHI